ncbi:serine protease Hayan-like [Zeugodacus cucurbitae]|uniref:serine protease Hayan-like n=1 Tax=Zeugodacus cucurbitae TaxID=28588 RepID=UPI0023D90B1C|nr:serine protease Hayan-like [Zeugodacus cucurbitae]
MKMLPKSNRITIALIILFAYSCYGEEQLEENDPCQAKHYKGICQINRNCPHLEDTMDAMGLKANSVKRCGFTVHEELICCPDLMKTTTTKPTEFTTISSKTIRDSLKGLSPEESKKRIKELMREAMSGLDARPPRGNSVSSRIAVHPANQACFEIEKELMPSIQPHVLNGTAANFGEYPHMARIMYDNVKLRCGGVLIDKRFVLTAAHCVDGKEGKAIKVVLGVTDFNDPTQAETRQDINIKKIHLPQNYTALRFYDDIAVIELDGVAVFNQHVYPTCLHTDEGELPYDIDLVVTGWGLTESKKPSDILLAANLTYLPVPLCDQSYANLNELRLNRGIIDTQLCAFSLYHDACPGDSGGPLHIVKDKHFNNYRVVGIVSFGPECGSDLPGVYTRVSDYLDFIEAVVWPDENDPCQAKHYKGICQTNRNCPHLEDTMNAMGLKADSVAHCGFTVQEEIICCPDRMETKTAKPTGLSLGERIKELMREAMSGSDVKPPKRNSVSSRFSNRPAYQACIEIEKHLMPSIQRHILNGKTTNFGEYPHMARIMYDNVKLRCGGVLIDKRFVLTAAHCVDGKEGKAIKVVLGVTDFNDPTQAETRQDINIKKIHLPQNYTNSRFYDDIALIELDGDAVFNQNVRPTCLHTDEGELLNGVDLVVTGWGLTEYKNTSDILLAANLTYIPVPFCDRVYANLNYWRLNRGIVDTQLCAYSPGIDACRGDSGGPLQIVRDKSINNYRVVGVVSIGPECGDPLPGVYTRVSKYLDFIEAVIWPVG